MVQNLATPHEAPDARTNTTTRMLLRCGVVAGPLFLAVVFVQAVIRDGFDLSRHPLSLLSLGELGWIQIANFAVTGVLYVACAVGMRRVLHPGRGGTWGPLLVGGLGVGLILAGVFVADAGAGFPPGAPAGAPERLSWHGIGHTVGFVVANFGMVVGCLVFARRFAADGHRGWVAACVATVVAVLALVLWPDTEGVSVRLVAASAILFGFVAALAVRLLREQRRAGGRGADGQGELLAERR
jgi:hypothetical membrane protein